jgi:hypothetical protein
MMFHQYVMRVYDGGRGTPSTDVLQHGTIDYVIVCGNDVRRKLQMRNTAQHHICPSTS